MSDPDGMTQTIREMEKHTAELETRLSLRSERVRIWKGLAVPLFDELTELTDNAEPTDAQRRFLEAMQYEPF